MEHNKKTPEIDYLECAQKGREYIERKEYEVAILFLTLALNETDNNQIEIRNLLNKASDYYDQTRGKYNLMNLSFDPFNQNDIENFIGPVEILSSEGKGRGLFCTKDIQMGELLFADKALIVQFDKDFKTSTINTSDNIDSNSQSLYTPSQSSLVKHLVDIVQSNPLVNAQLSALASKEKKHVNYIEGDSIPNISLFRSQYTQLSDITSQVPHLERVLPLPCPILDIETIRSITDVNAFEITYCGEPSIKMRTAILSCLTNTNKTSKGPRRIAPNPLNAIMQYAACPTIASHLINEIRTSKSSNIDLIELNQKDGSGFTAMNYAIFNKDHLTALILARSGADCNTQDSLGLTPLHYAVGKHWSGPRISECLLANHADIDAICLRGFTPLYAAVACRNSDAIRLLLNAGANPYIETALEGMSVMEKAEEMERDEKKGQSDVLRVFAEAGVVGSRVSCPQRWLGSAMHLLPSFMNHSDDPNTHRRYIGKMMFVYSRRPLKAGSELTTSYHLQASALKQFWGV